MDLETRDVVIVGLNSSSLAVAAQLADGKHNLRVKIFNEDDGFIYEAASMSKRLPTTFIRDLVTTSDPRSYFTFVNYLHQNHRLAAFINVSAMRPLQLEMKDYLHWVCDEIGKLGWIEHGQSVTDVRPMVSAATGKVESFSVSYRDRNTGQQRTLHAKRVVIVSEASRTAPQVAQDLRGRSLVLDTATAPKVLASRTTVPEHIAIIGCTQSAAELYEWLQQMPRRWRATWYVEQPHLRPTEDTPFVRSIVDDPSPRIASYPPELRQKLARTSSSTSRISPDLLDRLYGLQYTQHFRSHGPESLPFQIVTSTEVADLEIEQRRIGDKVRLLLKNADTGDVERSDATFDLVITGSEPATATTPRYLSSLKAMTETGQLDVGSDYQVNFARKTTMRNCGVWLLGTLATVPEDDMFLHLAEQGERVSQSILSKMDVTEGDLTNLVDSVL
ncbi:L-lysine 6-monooxygenase-like protein [Elsinoe fawcettii]|nr:L-lysine 6-monooxygenase-like protein [Elsinoe fawcettii]